MSVPGYGLIVLLLTLSAMNIACSEGVECRYVKKYNSGGRYVNYKEAMDICNVVYNGTLIDEKESSHFHRNHASAIVSKDQGAHWVRSDTGSSPSCRVSKFSGINAGVGSVNFSNEDCANTVKNIYCSVRSASISKTPYCTGQPCHVPHSNAGVTSGVVAPLLNITSAYSQYEWNNEGKCMPVIEMRNNRHWNRIIQPNIAKVGVMEAWKDKDVYVPVHRKMRVMQQSGGTGTGSTPVNFSPSNVELRVPYGDRFEATLEAVQGGGYKLSAKITTYHLNVRPFIGFTDTTNSLGQTTQLGTCSFPDYPDPVPPETYPKVNTLCASTPYILPTGILPADPYSDYSFPLIPQPDDIMTYSHKKIIGTGTDDIYVISIDHKFDAGEIDTPACSKVQVIPPHKKLIVRGMLLACNPDHTFRNIAFDDFKEFYIDQTTTAITSSVNAYSFSAMIVSSHFDTSDRGLTIKIVTTVKRNDLEWHLVPGGQGSTDNIFPVESSPTPTTDTWEIEWTSNPTVPSTQVYPACSTAPGVGPGECIQEWYLFPTNPSMIRDSYGIDSNYVIKTIFKLVLASDPLTGVSTTVSTTDSRFDIDLHVKRTSQIETVHLSTAELTIDSGSLVIGGQTVFRITNKLVDTQAHRIRFDQIRLCCSETNFPSHDVSSPESTGCNAEGYGIVKRTIYTRSDIIPYQPNGVTDSPAYPNQFGPGGNEIKDHSLTFSQFGILPTELQGFSITDDAMCEVEADYLLYDASGAPYTPGPLVPTPLHSQTMFSKDRHGRSALRRARERMANSHAVNNTYSHSTRISNVLKWEKGKMSKIVESDDNYADVVSTEKAVTPQVKYPIKCGGKYKRVGKKCVKEEEKVENIVYQKQTLSEWFVDFSTVHVTGREPGRASSRQRVFSALIVALFIVLVISFAVFTVLFVRAHMHDKKSERRREKTELRALYHSQTHRTHKYMNLHVT